MPANHHPHGNGRPRQSEGQRYMNSAMAQVMHAWEALDDEQRLAWDVHGSNRRMKGINSFKQVNMRRIGRGDPPTPKPLPPKLHDARPLLKAFHIRNRNGLITLELLLHRVPDSPRTVWASLPCNRGLKSPRACPRLGWLPVSRGGRCRITELYFRKHGAHISERGLALVGKRIFVRIRSEDDEGTNQYEQIRALVPPPEVRTGKKAFSSPKDH